MRPRIWYDKDGGFDCRQSFVSCYRASVAAALILTVRNRTRYWRASACWNRTTTF